MDIEVLMYISKLRTYIKNNQKDSEYFFINETNYNNHIDLFLEIITRFSIRNFNLSGNPQLTAQQFEMARSEISVLFTNEKNEKKININHTPIIFIDNRGYFKIKKK